MKLRLLKVVVHPIFVIDDGETLREFENKPSVVSAAEWPDFFERLNADIAEVEARMQVDANGKVLVEELESQVGDQGEL